MRIGALLALVVAGAQIGLSAQMKPLSPAAAEVAAVDKTWAEFYQSCNIDGMNKLLGDDMVFIHIAGNIENKTQFVNNVRLCNMEQAQTEPTNIRLYGTSAVVIGNLTYKVKGMAMPGQIVYTRVYVKDGSGKWSLVTHQSTTPTARR